MFLKYKSFIRDVFLNLVSNSVVLILIQLLIFPIFSRFFSQSEFGSIVSIYGINNVIVIFLGNTLNNLRLINRDKDRKFEGLVFISNILSIVLIIIFSLIYAQNLELLDYVLIIFFTFLSNARAYLGSYYRISLEYDKLLIQNLLISAGYLLGLLFFKFAMNSWAIVFVTGELFGYFYIRYTKNPLLKDFSAMLKLKSFEKDISISFFQLSCSNALSSSLNYLDRFIIIPILGAHNMSIFYAGSSVSKIVTMLITPMNNVILSYVMDSKREVSKVKFINIYIGAGIACIPIYFILNRISFFVTKILYPNLYLDASEIISIITIGILTNSIFSLLNPFVLKQFKLENQMIIQSVYGIVYLVGAIFLGRTYSLIGFSMAYTIANLAKVFMQIIVILFGKTNS